MSFPFNSLFGLILVDAEVTGPLGTAAVQMVLDTGATRSLIRSSILATVGCVPVSGAQQIQVTSVMGVHQTSLVTVPKPRSRARKN